MSVLYSYEELFYEFEPAEIPGLIEEQDVNAPDPNGTYLLTVACKRLQVANIEYLVSHGANPNVRDADGDTALLCAVNVCNHNPAAACQIIDILLDAGADIEARGYMNKTAFLKVCSRGCLEVLKLLVSRGCDINATAEDIDGCISGIRFADIFHTDRTFQEYLSSLYAAS